jgi:uncharacterized membrane protein
MENAQVTIPPEKHEKKIETKEALLYGWEKFKETYQIFVPALIVIIGLELVMGYLEKAEVSEFLVIGVLILGSIAEVIISMGLMKISLKIVDGEDVAFDDIFSVTHLFFSFLGASILYGLIVAGGMLLLIVPGLVWLVTYWLFQYAVVDRERGAIDSLRAAKEASEGVRWQLALFMGTLVIVNVAGFMALGIGLFITVPVTTIAGAYVYRALAVRVADGEKESVKESVPSEAPTAA